MEYQQHWLRHTQANLLQHASLKCGNSWWLGMSITFSNSSVPPFIIQPSMPQMPVSVPLTNSSPTLHQTYLVFSIMSFHRNGTFTIHWDRVHTTWHFQLEQLYLMTIITLPGCCLKTLVVCELVYLYLNFTPILCTSGLTITCIKLVLTYLLGLLTYRLGNGTINVL